VAVLRPAAVLNGQVYETSGRGVFLVGGELVFVADADFVPYPHAGQRGLNCPFALEKVQPAARCLWLRDAG
jgi:hypothetical protein